jgi:hypothetical protein
MIGTVLLIALIILLTVAGTWFSANADGSFVLPHGKL